MQVLRGHRRVDGKGAGLTAVAPGHLPMQRCRERYIGKVVGNCPVGPVLPLLDPHVVITISADVFSRLVRAWVTAVGYLARSVTGYTVPVSIVLSLVAYAAALARVVEAPGH
jgi:hypothetical protein